MDAGRIYDPGDPAILAEIYQMGVQDANDRLKEINRFIAMNA